MPLYCDVCGHPVPTEGGERQPCLACGLRDALSPTIGLSSALTTKMPLGDIVLGSGPTKRTYRPQPDITNMELATMLRMLIAMTFRGPYETDYEQFIIDNKLERHWPQEKS